MHERVYFTSQPSPLGELLLVSNGAALTGLYLPGAKGALQPGADWCRDDRLFTTALEQLVAYFAGDLQTFTLPLVLHGTPFQQAVWAKLQRIPYGQTRTYGELAQQIGQPSASRAVGHANARNPIAIIVPCHRVIGRSGDLTGYAGGMERKRWLLQREMGQVSLGPFA